MYIYFYEVLSSIAVNVLRYCDILPSSRSNLLRYCGLLPSAVTVLATIAVFCDSFSNYRPNKFLHVKFLTEPNFSPKKTSVSYHLTHT